MGLNIFFWEDIRNALLAADEASSATAAVYAEMDNETADHLLNLSRVRAYREGYKAALATVALAFGIAPQAIALRQDENKKLTLQDKQNQL